MDADHGIGAGIERHVAIEDSDPDGVLLQFGRGSLDRGFHEVAQHPAEAVRPGEQAVGQHRIELLQYLTACRPLRHTCEQTHHSRRCSLPVARCSLPRRRP
jgi:hypothetical protein